jgi:anti-sigma factor RsiW
MNPHVSELLAAYHDGELPLNRRSQVEKHLHDCETCRAELTALEQLSSFLKADLVPHQTSPERFAAQVQLRLPRALPSRTRQNGGQLPRWAVGVPLALVVIWAFIQAALKVTSFILTADQFIGTAGPFSSWITAEGLLKTNANLLLFNTILLIGTTILWSAWMAFWLAWNRNKNELSIKGVVR